MRIICLVLLGYGLGLTMASGQSVLPATHPKYQTAYPVVKQLAIASGSNFPLPRFTMYAGAQGNKIAAFYWQPEPELVMDEKLYDLCRNFGKDSLNALAIVIGHELAHYYLQHAEMNALALSSAQNSGKADPVTIKSLEAAADIRGAFMVFIAGFSPSGLVKPLYEAIYKAYRLPPEMYRYYSLEQRIEQAGTAEETAGKLRHLYTLGIFFFATEEYTYAYNCWKQVAYKFPLKEIHNNMGASKLLEAIRLLDTLAAPFRYPVEISTYNRLDPESVRGTPAKARTLLKEAILSFSKATTYDNTYQTAYINMATAYSLLDNPQQAIATINELQDLLRPSAGRLTPNAYLIRGIACLQNGQEAMAKKDFEQTRGAYEYTYNYGLYRQYPAFFSSASGKQHFFNWQRQFASASAPAGVLEKQMGRLSLPLSTAVNYQDTFNFSEPSLMRIKHGRTAEADVFQVRLANKQIEILSSVANGKASTGKSLTVGDDLAKVHALYGPARRIIPTGLGNTFYYYPDKGLLVDIRDNQVKKWMVFSQGK